MLRSTKVVLFFLLLFFFVPVPTGKTSPVTWYVRDGGGSVYGTSQATNTCNGQTNAVYSFGASPNCALNHPRLVMGWDYDHPQPVRWSGSDTLYVNGDSDVTPGTQAQYMIGYDETGGTTPTCTTALSKDCELGEIPAGTSGNPTKLIGTGTHKPQFWGNQNIFYVIRADNNYIDIENIEVTDHSDCSYNDPVNACNLSGSYPFGAFARTGMTLGSLGITLKDVYVHGLAIYAIVANAMTNPTFTRVWAIGNGFGGIILGNDGASAITGKVSFKQPIIEWNGCQEKYPLSVASINSPSNYKNCFGQTSGGYGDGLAFGATGSLSAGDWELIGPGSVSFNTSDGLDILHGIGGVGTDNIDKIRFEGNAGQQIKVTGLTANITNSVVIGDCGWWYGAAQSVAGGMAPGDSCRAGGSTIAYNIRTGTTISFYNDTFATNGILLNPNDSPANGCDVTTIQNFKNNIVIGGYTWLDSTGIVGGAGGNSLATFFYNSGTDGNGAGSCGSKTLTEDYNIVINTKNSNSPCAGTHDKCGTDPGITGTLPMGTSGGGVGTFYQGQSALTLVPIATTSAAKGAGVTGLTYWNSSTDIYDSSYASPPSMGAIEYNSKAGTGYMCEFDASCSGGACTNNFCGGSCNANSTSCSDGYACCTTFCLSGACASCIANDVASGSAANCCSGIVSGGNCVACVTNGNTATLATDCCSGLISGGVCQAYICGDATVSSPEVCDGSNLNSQTCATRGYNGGTLACAGDCLTFNETSCTNACLSAGLDCSSNGQCCSTICNSSLCVNAGGDITTGLVGWWKFDDGSGSTAADSSGLSNTATLINSPTFSTAQIGTNALTFTSASSQGARATSFSTSMTNMTVCAWVKTSSNTSPFLFSLNRTPSNYTNEGILQLNGTGKLLFWDYNGNYGYPTTSNSSSTAVNDNNWHHVCFAKNGTSGTYYKDGVADGTVSAAANVTYSTNGFSIGYDYRDTASYLNGSLDDVRVYKRTLSSADVSALYAYTGSCTGNNGSCSSGSDCCSGICSNGLCSNGATAPTITCQWYGQFNGTAR